MYVSPNFKSKKALKDALAAGKRVTVFSPGPFPCQQDGKVTIEGPHYPEPHKWHGTAQVENGVVKSVK